MYSFNYDRLTRDTVTRETRQCDVRQDGLRRRSIAVLCTDDRHTVTTITVQSHYTQLIWRRWQPQRPLHYQMVEQTPEAYHPTAMQEVLQKLLIDAVVDFVTSNNEQSGIIMPRRRQDLVVLQVVDQVLIRVHALTYHRLYTRKQSTWVFLAAVDQNVRWLGPHGCSALGGQGVRQSYSSQGTRLDGDITVGQWSIGTELHCYTYIQQQLTLHTDQTVLKQCKPPPKFQPSDPGFKSGLLD